MAKLRWFEIMCIQGKSARVYAPIYLPPPRRPPRPLHLPALL